MLEFIAETSRLTPHWSVRKRTGGTLVGHIYQMHARYVFSASSVLGTFDPGELDQIANFLEKTNERHLDKSTTP